MQTHHTRDPLGSPADRRACVAAALSREVDLPVRLRDEQDVASRPSHGADLVPLDASETSPPAPLASSQRVSNVLADPPRPLDPCAIAARDRTANIVRTARTPASPGLRSREKPVRAGALRGLLSWTSVSHGAIRLVTRVGALDAGALSFRRVLRAGQAGRRRSVVERAASSRRAPPASGLHPPTTERRST